MRLHLRLLALCTVAALAAGCAENDKNTSPVSGNNAVNTLGECTVDIGDRVWFDVNCNGIQDKDETGGPEGITVTLINCNDEEVTYDTTTDSDGDYLFDDVPAGTYQICIEIPEGYEASLEDEGSNDGIDSDGNDEGCTPGFWRNHLEHWDATPYSPDDLVNDTFGCDLVDDDDTTLGEVIDAPQTYGALAFHAVAALLNATHPDVDFGLDTGDVLDLACDGDKGGLASENEEGCPLSGGNTTGGSKPRAH